MKKYMQEQEQAQFGMARSLENDRGQPPVSAMSLAELRATGSFEGWTDERLAGLQATIRGFTELVYGLSRAQEQQQQQGTKPWIKELYKPGLRNKAA